MASSLPDYIAQYGVAEEIPTPVYSDGVGYSVAPVASNGWGDSAMDVVSRLIDMTPKLADVYLRNENTKVLMKSQSGRVVTAGQPVVELGQFSTPLGNGIATMPLMTIGLIGLGLYLLVRR